MRSQYQPHGTAPSMKEFVIRLTKFTSILLALMVITLPGVTHSRDQNITAHPFVVTGVVKNTNNATLIEDFADYLSKRSGYPLKVVFATSYSDLTKKMHDDPNAIGWTCGAPYVQDHKMYNQQLIAVPTFNHLATYYSIVLTRHVRPEKKLSDFKNGVLAYSDPRSNSGYLAPKYALHKQGINIESYFRLLLNAGNHEGSIEALLSGLADVAAVDEYIWIAYVKANPKAAKKLKEIERMGPYPFTPIVASKGVNKVDIEKLTLTLINMKNNNAGKKILDKFVLNSFVIKTDAFYSPINKMLEHVDLKTGI